MGRNHRRIQHSYQRLDTGRFDADGLDHAYAQFAGQPCCIDQDSLAARNVGHVERDHHGQTEPLQAQHQSQVLAQIGRVGDANDEVRPALARAATKQDIGGHLLVRCQRIEAVGTGQVQDAHAPARWSAQRTFLPLDRYAGVVGDLLAAAREDVE